ncbi:MAG: hypothetical protein K0S34_82 [Bacillales bacterium]|jgi:SPP1 family holin|nr:hypothetical protein [Bacillales bacterium]
MKPSKETIIRTIVLFILLINQSVFLFKGYTLFNFDEEQLEIYVTNGVTVAATLWSWWKNNSFSKNAIQADNVLKILNEVGEK